MITSKSTADCGVLVSGGVDSCILTARLLDDGRRVQPFYIRSGLRWEEAEYWAAERFLGAIAAPALEALVTLDLPVRDLYGEHWSVNAGPAPAADSPDEAVFLPGRNALLILKAALWCQMHGIGELALAPLVSNPFDDASGGFFAALEAAINLSSAAHIRIVRPFCDLHKSEVMRWGGDLPLELTFSCLSPDGARHCGQCNKCAERRKAFEAAGLADRTEYSFSERPSLSS